MSGCQPSESCLCWCHQVWKFTCDRLDELENRVKDIEYRLCHIVKLPSEIDIRLQDVERQLNNLSDSYVEIKKSIKKPHKCPVCDGLCYTMQPHHETILGMPTKKQCRCNACEGKGIVWE